MEVIGKERAYVFSAQDVVRFSNLYFDFLPHATTFIKKELVVTVGLYDESFAIILDWKFFILGLFKYNCSYKKVNEILSTFHADGISSNENHFEEKQVLDTYFAGYITDYEKLIKYRDLKKTNRFKMLSELEKSILGKKAASLFLRTYFVLFLMKKLKNLL